MTTEAIGERVAKLEGSYEHLATKADVERISTKISDLETRLIKWLIGVVLLGMGVAAAIATALQKVFGS